MAPSYLAPGLTLSRGTANNPAHVRELQRDLRALGYLRNTIDGNFGQGTELAVRALQVDLLVNRGTGRDGNAPVDMTSFNNDGQGSKLVASVTGALDQNLARCIAALLADTRMAKLPFADDPKAENARALTEIASSISRTAPTPFIAAMVVQESSGQHYHVPRAGDDDRYVTVGVDRNDGSNPDRITSRGYGIGQYTLFHHPPSDQDVADFIVDPIRNVQQAFAELRDKFENFVVGPVRRASDRDVEHPLLPMRFCKYQPTDARYMNDCKACATAARKVNIANGTPVYQGATISYQPSQYYPSAVYTNVPDRSDFRCDWPYAARRYNGSGINSFHYQTRILLNLLK